MHFSLLTQSLNPNHGYGVVAAAMVRSLEQLGHTVSLRDPSAPVEIAFCQPGEWEWSSDNSYKIGYTPWESTRLPASWTPEALASADEIWTTSEWCKKIFEKNGLSNVRVYEHGIDTFGDFGWPRHRRARSADGIKFLHMGEPALRKGGQLTYDVFTELFGGRDDVSLTIKAHDFHNIQGIDAINVESDGSISIGEPDGHKNVTVITEDMNHEQLVSLIHAHDVLVYPSWGEGFGLIPLQAMVTGMPVICPVSWAPYWDLLVPSLALSSKLVRSPWPTVHTGNMYEPNREDLAETMLHCVTDFGKVTMQALSLSYDVESRYDWLGLTQRAFNHIVNKFDSI